MAITSETTVKIETEPYNIWPDGVIATSENGAFSVMNIVEGVPFDNMRVLVYCGSDLANSDLIKSEFMGSNKSLGYNGAKVGKKIFVKAGLINPKNPRYGKYKIRLQH
jgi:hypothetical protein